MQSARRYFSPERKLRKHLQKGTKMKNKKCPCRKHCWDYRDSNCDNCDIGKCVSGLHKKLDKYKTENLKLKAENERLRTQKYYIHSDGRIEMIPTVESVRADTIREMHERLLARKVSYGNITFRVVPVDDIDQIAKEMLKCKE